MKEHMRQRDGAAGFMKAVLWSVFALVAAVSIGHFVAAEETLLQVAEKTIYPGDRIEIATCFSEEQVENVTYTLADASGNTRVLELTEDGIVTALKAGTAQITISYNLPESPVSRQELFTVTVIEPQKLSGVYGEQLSVLEAWKYYDTGKYEVIFSGDSLNLTGDRIYVVGLEDATVSLKRKEGDDSAFEVAKVSITKPVLLNQQFARAQGTSAFAPDISYFQQMMQGKVYRQDIIDAAKVQWNIEGTQSGSTAGNAIARATEQGIQALSVGNVKVSATLTAMNGDQITLTGQLYVTNPVLQVSRLVMAKGVTKAMTVQGTCALSTYTSAKSEVDAVKDLAYISTGLKIYAAKKGTIDVSIIVDGKVLTVHVIVTNPKFSSTSLIMYKKQSKTVKVTGINSTYSTVVFSSSNKKIATVSKKGVVKAKKSGRVRIYAQVDGKKIYALAEVSSKAGYQASRKAIAISKTKTTYSQLRRMSKKYYDCSSLVSRVYRPYGVYFGVKRGWSPTAAAIGKWCVQNKKTLSKKAVSYTKLLPGDIICYSYTRNGRYRNISHIEIYVGNGKNVSASSSYGRVVHYAYKNGSTALVARPKK